MMSLDIHYKIVLDFSPNFFSIRPPILLLNNIFLVRQNENKHRFIIMTQNFFFLSPFLSFSLSFRFFSVRCVLRALSKYHHHLIAPYIWLCVSLFFLFHNFIFAAFIFLLQRSPEQYTKISAFSHLTYDSWGILFLMAFRSIIYKVVLLTFPGILSGSRAAFLTRKIIVTSSLPPSFVFCFLFSGSQRAQKASFAPIMRLNVIRLSRYINCI